MLSEIIRNVKENLTAGRMESSLELLFRNETEHEMWRRRVCSGNTIEVQLEEGYVEGWLE